MATLLKTVHLHGMQDSAGSPGSIIDTQKIDVYGDGTLKFTIDGFQYSIRSDGTGGAKLLNKIITTSRIG